MYSISKSIDMDFAHIVAGHPGACINLHGHTWKFEVEVGSDSLNPIGFVTDFKNVKSSVLEPVHLLLDHSLALGHDVFKMAEPHLEELGKVFTSTRGNGPSKFGGYKYFPTSDVLGGARQVLCGGMKVAVFPFSPTSERLAFWLYSVAAAYISEFRPFGGRAKILRASVYETLHPVESVAHYRP